MNVIKRNGKEVLFDKNKIIVAISKANKEVDEKDRLSEKQIIDIANDIESKAIKFNRMLNIEEIQDMVERSLVSINKYCVAKSYIIYRYVRALEVGRDDGIFKKVMSIIGLENEEVIQENSNKNPIINSTQRDYIAGEVSKEISRNRIYDKEVIKAHDEGLIHKHDMDYMAQKMNNCGLVNLADMANNNTVISSVLIEKPHRLPTMANIATQIIAQVASSQYGGQSISLADLAPFVEVSRKYIREKLEDELRDVEVSESTKKSIVESRLKDHIKDAVQTIQYQIITLMTTNGQAPFITLFMYLNEARSEKEKEDMAMLIEEVLLQRIQGVKNETGHYITPAFPKLIYVLEEDNIKEDSKYYYLTKLAAKCTAKRMVPDYISEKKVLESKYPANKIMDIKDRRDQWGDESMWGINPFKDLSDEQCDILQEYVDESYKKLNKEFDNTKAMEIIKKHNIDHRLVIPIAFTCMGCRSFLTPDYIHYKTYGRFNQSVCTINLPDVALSSEKDKDKFWKIFDERLELCKRALMTAHNNLLGTKSDVAPILWQYGAYARLKKGEVIDKLLYDNYSTISLGYGGLYECVKYMTGKSHTDPDVMNFAKEIMQYMNYKCAKWRAETNISFSLYGTPMESLTYKFAKSLQKRFGIIEGITDRSFITNSYHVFVEEEINAFDKLKLESEFQELSPGGAISYVEVPNMQDNIPAVLSVIQFIYDNIMYAELNTKSDYCQECGFDGEIEMVENENKKLIWKCPKCGNTDKSKMNIARRTCGYIGLNDFNQGRMDEIRNRVLHL